MLDLFRSVLYLGIDFFSVTVFYDFLLIFFVFILLFVFLYLIKGSV